MNPRTDEEIREYVIKNAANMAEFFTSVRVFVTWQDHDNAAITRSFDTHAGNWHASFGQIVEWLEIEKERARIAAHEDP